MSNVTTLKKNAKVIRRNVLKMVYDAGSGHIAGPLGMADIFSYLYFDFLKVNPKKPEDKNRDYFFLSNGHICPGLYAALAMKGFFSLDKLNTLRKFESPLQGHPHRAALPGIESSSGPLGSGLSQAAGAACALRLNKSKRKVVCMTSDGEHQEGNTWEGVMFAGKEKLSNLIVVVDYNNIQIDGFVSDVMPLNDLQKTYHSFGWNAQYIDAHNYSEIKKAFEHASKATKPTAIIAKSTPGKGVSFIENDYKWHGKAPTKEELEKALEELK